MRVLYFIKKAILSIVRNISLNTFTTIIIASSLLVLNIFLLISHNLNSLLSKKSYTSMFIYLNNENDVKAYEKQISSLLEIEEIEFSSSNDSFKKFKNDLKDDSYLLEGVEKDILPAYFKIILKNRAENIEKTISKLKKMDFINDVEYGEKIYKKIEQLNNIFINISYYIIMFIVIAIIFTIYTTVKLTIYNRRSELETMNLVGATKKFIIMPFYIESIILGTISTILSYLLLYAGFIMFSKDTVSSVFHSIGLLELKFIPFHYIILSIIFTSILGLMASHLSVTKFLKK